MDFSRVIEVININSLELALRRKYVTAEEVLEWLSTGVLDSQKIIAYYILCNFYDPNKQYLSNGKHIIITRPSLYFIASQMGLDENIIIEKNHDDNIITHIIKILTEGLTDEIDEESEATLKFIMYNKPCNNSQLYSAMISRLFDSSVDINIRNRCYISCDKYHYVTLTPESISLILNRESELREKANNYYEKIMRSHYEKIFSIMHKENYMWIFNGDQLQQLFEKYPHINTGQHIPDLLLRKITLMPEVLAGYILGFPIEYCIPTKNNISSIIEEIIKNGSNYTEYIKMVINRQTFPSTPLNPVTIIGNESDVMMESFSDYLPFDVVGYRQDNCLYRFSRCEFNNCIDKEKNPWTNERLSVPLITLMVAKNTIAENLNLPECNTYPDLIEKILTGNLSITTQKNTSKINTGAVINNLFDRLLVAGIVNIASQYQNSSDEIENIRSSNITPDYNNDTDNDIDSDESEDSMDTE